VFDTEIKNEIGQNGIGWKDFDKMGVSVACSYSFRTQDFKVYMDDNLAELAEDIERADIATGFYTEGFDIPLLEAELRTTIRKDNHWDILNHSRRALGWRPGVGGGKMPHGCKLDNHLIGTFGREAMKTGHGSEAPKWWRERRMGKLISYCLDDVKREARLFQYAWNNGIVKTDTHGVHTLLEPPRAFYQRRGCGPQPPDNEVRV
jgi:DEAD/DEAH box helicase domain-containing protein